MALLTGKEIIEIAIRLEKDGQAFYTRAEENASSPAIQRLFRDLAEQEMQHRRTFETLGRDGVALALSPEQWEEFQAYVAALLQQRLLASPEGALSQAAVAANALDALKAALAFEKETLLFFHELRLAVHGPGQQTVERVIDEEKGHIQRLASMVATL